MDDDVDDDALKLHKIGKKEIDKFWEFLQTCFGRDQNDFIQFLQKKENIIIIITMMTPIIMMFIMIMSGHEPESE